MNDLVREFIETHPQYDATLKHMPKFESDVRTGWTDFESSNRARRQK